VFLGRKQQKINESESKGATGAGKSVGIEKQVSRCAAHKGVVETFVGVKKTRMKKTSL
jgi:hypothetical protein